MKINRNSKIGEIKDLNIEKLILIGTTAGALMVSSIFIGKSIERNIKLNSFESNRYDTYSEQIADIYDISLDQESEYFINSLLEKKELVEDFKNSESDNDKQHVFQKIKDDNIKEMILKQIKTKYADKYGGSWDEYTISKPSDYDTHSLVSISWAISRNGEEHSILDEASSLLNAYDEFETEEKYGDMKSCVHAYDKLIMKSINYVGKTSDKAK